MQGASWCGSIEMRRLIDGSFPERARRSRVSRGLQRTCCEFFRPGSPLAVGKQREIMHPSIMKHNHPSHRAQMMVTVSGFTQPVSPWKRRLGLLNTLLIFKFVLPNYSSVMINTYSGDINWRHTVYEVTSGDLLHKNHNKLYENWSCH